VFCFEIKAYRHGRGFMMQDISNTVKCPNCGVNLNKKNLEKHLKKVHGKLLNNNRTKTSINIEKKDSKKYSQTHNFLTESCTCHGNNENCFLCGGWGYIDVVGKKLGDPGRKILTSGTIRRKKNVNKNSVGNNKSKILNSKQKMQNSETVKNKKQKDAQTFPRKTKNKDNQHPNDSSDMKNDCNRKINNARIISRPSNITKNGFTSKAIVKILNEKNIENRLDATREYYDKYRDHGKFGSFPSHDCYDEESKP
jgi:uncharacterized C2H2 Zn-finger protein